MNTKAKIKKLVNYDSYRSKKIFFVLRNIYRKNQKSIQNNNYPEVFMYDLLNLVADCNLLLASYQTKVIEKKVFFNQNNFVTDFSVVSRLIRSNCYPWGENKSIFFLSKNGVILKEQVKIPPWMDYVVQDSMVTVLKAIYEPLFDSLSCSFGYGCNFGVRDAILRLRTFETERFSCFVKGEFSFPSNKLFYQTKILLVLSKKIKDKKFLNFFLKQLHYVSQRDFFDISFLMSLYLFTFDQYVLNHLKWRDEFGKLKSVYIRYVYEWVLFTNQSKEVVDNLITLFKQFSTSFLYVPLFITPVYDSYKTRKLFCFLGFDFKFNTKLDLVESQSSLLFLNFFKVLDKRRLFYIFSFKGFCNNKGFPREIGFLTSLQDAFIIEWFNLLAVGLALYYWKFINNPSTNFSFWLYIVKYSCLKTLAQKHKLTLKKAFKKYALFNLYYKKSKVELGIEKIYVDNTYISNYVFASLSLNRLVYKRTLL